MKETIKAILFYRHWPYFIRATINDFRESLKFNKALFKNQINTYEDEKKMGFYARNKLILIPKQNKSHRFLRDERVIAATSFDKLFSTPELKKNKDVLDFTQPIILLNKYLISTNIGMVNEIPEMNEYNRHYPLKKGDIVFDCGAFHGIYTLLISKKIGPTGKVYCFEPDPDNLTILQYNLDFNNIKNVVVVPKGLWDSETTLSFASGNDSCSCVDEKGKTKIDVTTFAKFCEENQVIPNFVKMDIEGAELEAIKGSIDYIKEHNIHFAIASYHERDGKQTFSGLESMFSELGYSAKTELVNKTLMTFASGKG